ncbi:RRS1 protein, partial [Polypterus senegalus]
MKCGKLPTERVQEAVVAKLPEPQTRLPREKPLPKPRPPTKWEEFAKLKGIRKKKKTNLVWDDVHKEWRRRWGYKRAKDDTKDWLIEVPESADPNEDQFARRMKAKKERVAKNELNRLKNIARGQKVSVQVPTKDQSKAELGKAMQLARISTASVGKFQDKLPKEKPIRTVGKKRSFQPLIGDFNTEKQRQLDLLKVMESKKPRMNVTRAVNRQMREEDAEAARHKKDARRGGKGGKKKGRGGGGGKGRGGPKGKKHHGK